MARIYSTTDLPEEKTTEVTAAMGYLRELVPTSMSHITNFLAKEPPLRRVCLRRLIKKWSPLGNGWVCEEAFWHFRVFAWASIINIWPWETICNARTYVRQTSKPTPIPKSRQADVLVQETQLLIVFCTFEQISSILTKKHVFNGF